MSINYTTPEFRASYANVWEPKTDDNGNNVYSISMVFNKDDLSAEDLAAMKKCIRDAIAEKFGKDESKWPRAMKICMRDADQEDRTNPNLSNYDSTYVNSFFINARTYNKPGIVNEKIEKIIDKSEFYSGCYARATVVFQAYDNVSKGVGCYLNNLMKTRDGDRLGGAPPPEKDFEQFKPKSDASESDFVG